MSRITMPRHVLPVVLLLMVGAGCGADPPSAVVGVVVEGCDPAEQTGSGVVVAPGLVLTSAHVLAGATRVQMVRDGLRSDATIVAFDPEMDLAYLEIADRSTQPMSVGSDHVANGDDAVAYVVRDGEPVVLDVQVVRRVQIRTEDIYVEGETLRPGFELAAEIDEGDSGGAVMVDGEVAGVVWSKSRRTEHRAWAIDPARAGDVIRNQLESGHIDDEIDLTRCP